VISAPPKKSADYWGLHGPALLVGRELYRRWPDSEITSGLRSRADQASAMAKNELRSPGWIAATYAASAPKRALVDCLATKPKQLAEAFLAVLAKFSDDELAALTKHLSGRAFDVRAMLEACIRTDGGAMLRGTEYVRFTPVGSDIVSWLRGRAVAYGGKFLTREGGLIVLHWQE